MIRRSLLLLALSTSYAAAITACGSSDSEGAPETSDAATAADATTDGGAKVDAADASHPSDATAASDAASDGGATTTIAAARQAQVTTPITVTAVVTALHGTIPNDVSEWYVEDPAGGPYSGVVVYCDPDKSACPTIRAPSRGSLVQITGALETYQGQVQLVPTSQTVLSTSGTFPPIPTVSVTELAPSGTSTYRGVLVKLAAGTTLTVDDVTPPALLNSECTTILAPDGGADAGDAGVRSCSYLCSPPAYSGFTANDGKGDEVNIEATFFATDPLQSSPECLGQPGVVPVTKGTTFSAMQGVLDYDGYAKQQQLSPVEASDYATP